MRHENTEQELPTLYIFQVGHSVIVYFILELWKLVIGFRRLNCHFDAFVVLHNFKDLKAHLYNIDL